MFECTYQAIYSDGKAYDVEWNDLDGGSYLICTNGSLIPVPFYISESHFVEYKCIGIAGLTEGSFWEQDSLMRKRLRAPSKPATAPPVVEPDNDESFVPKFHCPRLPGENSFAYLQRANAQKVEWERTQRAIARRSHMSESESAAYGSQKVAEAETARQTALNDRRPRGRGVGQITE